MERVIIAAAHRKGAPLSQVESQLQELAGLVAAAGGLVVERFSQGRDNPAAGLGRGALETLKALLQERNASLLVFDQELSPSALFHIARAVGEEVRVVDRTQIILDIFATRARTREARVQVALAQYKYLEPRLKGQTGWSRLGGGIGTRGPGETHLEVERRHMRRRIRELTQELSQIELQRGERRQRRTRTELPVIALVGYTNVGKSTLYGALTRTPQEARDALFVTLDTTIRRIQVPQFGAALIADTVGFVDRLPHDLVAAFRSTLAEVRDANLILEVISADPAFAVSAGEQRRVIHETLKGLGVGHLPHMAVYSQWDRVGEDSGALPPGGHKVAALYGEGIDALLEDMGEQLKPYARDVQVWIKWEQAQAWRLVYSEFAIVSRQDFSEGCELWLRGSERAFSQLTEALARPAYSSS